MLYYNIPKSEIMFVAAHVRRWKLRLLCGFFLLFSADLGAASPVSAGAAPSVVVSLNPLHSIVANVMNGVGSPLLLMSGSESPHSFALKPSQARELQRADAIFWVGPELEQFLTGPLKTLAKRARIVTFTRVAPLLAYRKQGLWIHSEQHAGKPDQAHGGAHDHGVNDPHFWLDPVRVRDIVPEIERLLSEIDPANAAIYGANAARLIRRLEGLHRQLEAVLAPVREVPYLVLHDAYQYIEARYRLAAIGSLVLDPEVRPGARHVAGIRRIVAQSKVRCVFSEPQLPRSVLSAVSGTHDIIIGELDPLGAAQTPGPDAYFQILLDLAKKLAGCLRIGEVGARSLIKN